MPKIIEIPKAKTEGKYFYAVGRRKRAIAQVRLFDKGKGEITINGKKFDKYFTEIEMHNIIKLPLKICDLENKTDLTIIVRGGGKKGQADAIKHGLSRALDKYNKELHKTLKVAGFLTRDARIKERKKPGLKRARRAPQWSKR